MCSPTCADLPTAPTKRKKQIKSRVLISVEKNGMLTSDLAGAREKITE